jgi:hypothetical protein
MKLTEAEVQEVMELRELDRQAKLDRKIIKRFDDALANSSPEGLDTEDFAEQIVEEVMGKHGEHVESEVRELRHFMVRGIAQTYIDHCEQQLHRFGGDC